MTADQRYVDLKLDRGLIDSNFDGYKLSLDPLPIYQLGLETGQSLPPVTIAAYCDFIWALLSNCHQNLE